jgi:chorismate synthase
VAGLSWRTAGESHGRGLLGILDGLPAGLAIEAARIDAELARRQGGYGRSGRMKIEKDQVEILGGLRAGKTIGAPLALLLANKDASIERLGVPDSPRPAHADLAGCQKLTERDPRAVMERASARETAMRVALAGAARQLLEHFGVEIFAYVQELGGLGSAGDAFERAGVDRGALRDASEFFSLDPGADVRWRELVDRARSDGDTLGGVFEVRTAGLPPGLGGYAQPSDRLTGRLGAALLSIPGMKSIEFGLGRETARKKGSEVHDAILLCDPPGRFGRFRRATNRAGGLEGGMTTGEELVVRLAMKPIPTLRQGLPTVGFETGEAVVSTYQRSDVTSVPAASVVGEAMVALVLASALLEKLGGDSMAQVEDAYGALVRRLASL